MSVRVLLSLLKELGKRDKMRGLPSILSLFRIEFNKFSVSCCITNGDREGRIFPSYPHTNDGFFFFHTIKYGFFIFLKRAP